MHSAQNLPETPFTAGERLAGGCIALFLWMLSAAMLVGLTAWSVQPSPMF